MILNTLIQVPVCTAWEQKHTPFGSLTCLKEKCAEQQQTGLKNKDWMHIDWASVSVGHLKAVFTDYFLQIACV